MLQPSRFLRKDLPMDHQAYLLFFLTDLKTPWYWGNTMPMKRIELQTRIIVTTLVISPTSLRHALQWPDVLDLKTFISQSCQSTPKNLQCSWWQRMEMLKSLIHHSRYSSPPQLRYPQLSYFHSNAILNWVPKNSS